MSLTCLEQVVLAYAGGGSDKVYVIQIAVDGMEHTIIAYYGRRGARLSKIEKYRGLSLVSAQREFRALESAKRFDRTSPYSTATASVTADALSGMPSSAPKFGGPAVIAPLASATLMPTPAAASWLPMLAKKGTPVSIVLMLASSDWVLMKKYDGERCIVSLRRSGITATNRDGLPRSLTTEVLESLSKLLSMLDFSDAKETVLDGECMGSTYVAYDILILRDNDVRHLSFQERYSMLEILLAKHPHLLAPVAWDNAEKLVMRAKAKLEDWEGDMFRHLDSPYVAGRSDYLIKDKFWATATCRVLAVNKKRSIQLGILEADGSEQFVGNVSVPVDQDIPEPDSLVEIRYLYALPEGSLYQPTLLRVRTDVRECDCRADLRKAPPEKLLPTDADSTGVEFAAAAAGVADVALAVEEEEDI